MAPGVDSTLAAGSVSQLRKVAKGSRGPHGVAGSLDDLQGWFTTSVHFGRSFQSTRT